AWSRMARIWWPGSTTSSCGRRRRRSPASWGRRSLPRLFPSSPQGTSVPPIVPFVPEGNIDPPDSHMKYPSTISVTEETYAALLTDICGSLRAHGFKKIILIGDSGGNQTGMKNVAAALNTKWKGKGCSLYFIPEYYDFTGVSKWLEEQGIKQTPEGLHDDFAMTAMMMSVDPS